MVDFQSRDTKRGFGDEEEDAPDGEATADSGDAPEPERPDTDTDTEDGTDAGAADGVAYAVVTVASGRTLAEDAAGNGVVETIENGGDTVVTRELLAPSYDGIQTAVAGLVGRGDVDAVVTVGGTGVEPTDVTVDAVGDLFDKHLPGFGELFRVVSRDHVGTAAVRTRATAGVIDGVPAFCLPGDPAAARLGAEEVIVPEAGALVAQAGDGGETA